MTERHFFPQMKLADMIHSHLALATLLPRFGMDFGFGEKTIKQSCELYNIDCQFFLLICDVYSFPEYFPSETEIKSINVQNLLSFLSASHQYYLKERLPHIEAHWKKIIQNTEKTQREVLLRFFSEYQSELATHFEYEENTVFPHIQKLYNGQVSKYSIHQFEKKHSNIEDKLTDIIHIVLKYLPGKLVNEDRISILEDIAILRKDINRHTMIENKILIPYVEYIENKTNETL